MFDVPLQLEIVGQTDHLAIDAGADEAAAQHVLEKVLVLALLPADNRGQDEKPRAFREGEDAGQYLLARLGCNRPPALGAVAQADASKQHSEVIVNLGDRA